VHVQRNVRNWLTRKPKSGAAKELRYLISLLHHIKKLSWVKELVIIKTFVGLKFQEAILQSVANYFQTTHRLAKPAEEAVGIDGFIGDKPVSIKSTSYEVKKSLSEIIEAPILFYEKVKDGIKITFNEKLMDKD